MEQVARLGTAQGEIDRLRAENRRLLEQASAVANANAHAAELMIALEDARDEVSALNTQMQEILSNVAFGFLTVGPDHHIGSLVTASCHALLGTEQISGRTLEDLLGSSPEQRAHLSMCLDEVFDDVMPEELNLAQLPSRCIVGQRILAVSARALRDDMGLVRSVLFSLSDATQLEQQEHENAKNRALIQVLRQGEAFGLFLTGVHDLLSDARAAAKHGDQASVRHAVHTIKGNCSCFGLSSTASTIHELEAHEVMDDGDLNEIEHALASFLSTNRDILQADWPPTNQREARGARVTIAQLDALSRNAADKDAVLRWAASASRLRAGELLGPVEDLVRDVAERVGKRAELRLHGMDTRIPPERFGPVLQCVGHLLRNAVTHGIEEPELRGDKPETGGIELRISASEDVCTIEVCDDGAGIDADALMLRAVDHGLVSPNLAANMTREQKLALVFEERLSTVTTASEVAGRGVGMPAVRQTVEAHGGKIHIETETGRGTRIKIVMPTGSSSSAGRSATEAPISATSKANAFEQQFVIASGPEDAHRATLGLATALSAAASGARVVCFFTMRGAKWTGDADVQEESVPGFPRMKDLLSLLIESGATLEACSGCVDTQLVAPEGSDGRKILAEGFRYAGLSEATMRMTGTPTAVY